MRIISPAIGKFEDHQCSTVKRESSDISASTGRSFSKFSKKVMNLLKGSSVINKFAGFTNVHYAYKLSTGGHIKVSYLQQSFFEFALQQYLPYRHAVAVVTPIL